MRLNRVRLASWALGAGLIVGAVGALVFMPEWDSLDCVPHLLFSAWGLLAGVYLVFRPERGPLRFLSEQHRRPYLAHYSLNHGTELVWWIGRDSRILDVNDRLVSALGFTREELLGRPVSAIDLGWVPQRAAELWSRAAGGDAEEQETMLVRRDRTPLPCAIIIRHYRDFDDEFLCVFAHDISVEKRVSDELKEIQALFEGFLTGLPIGAFVRHEEGLFLYVNKQFAQWNPGLLAGKTTEEVHGTALARMFAVEDRQVIDEGPAVFLHESLSDGQVRYFEIHKFPLRIPGRPGLVGGVVVDSSDRRKTEMQVRESRAFLEAVISQSPVGIIIVDAETARIVIGNAGAKALLDIAPETDLSGRTISGDGKNWDILLGWDVLNADGTTPSQEQNPLYKAFFHRSSSNDQMLLRSPRAERSVVINSGPIYDARGQFMAAIIALLDVTELREAQDQLEQMNRGLELMVSDRTRELSQSNEALKITIDNLRMTQDQLIESEKMASLGGLVAGVAHEINTPVGVGVTAASFLKEKTDVLDKLYQSQNMKKSDLEAYLDQARQSSSILLSNLDRASNLIKSFKMISVDQSSDLMRSFKPREYFADLFLSLHAPDKRTKVAVRLDGDPELEVRSYPGAFSQIVTNLFMNSCLHGFEGRADGQVALDFWVAKDRLALRYSDDGCGMDEPTLRKIYEPFFTTRRDLGGTGLGMHIVFNLVTQKLGGSIKASSAPGRGAEFVLDLPLELPG
jgi:signal transduction histidine kinase